MIPIAHTTDEAPGAMPNGTKVVKILTGRGDAHRNGDVAIVRGSIGPFENLAARYGYWVEWDDTPGVPVFIAGNRLEAVNEL